MATYYINDTVDSAWVDAKARAAAESFQGINYTQLRKFYGDVKALERQWRAGGGSEATFASVLPLFRLLKAKSDYAQKRRVVPRTFRDWLWEHVDSVKKARDFEVFLLHFEAVVGFAYDGSSR